MFIIFADKLVDNSSTLSTIIGLISITSALCSFICFFILPNSVKDLWQISQGYNLFAVECIACWCESSLSWLMKIFGQLSHSYLGRSMECIFAIWVLRLPANVNFFKHSWHWNFFSPLWIVKWVFNPACVVNFFGHMSQEYSLPTKCVSWCFFSVVESINVFGQNSHCVDRFWTIIRVSFIKWTNKVSKWSNLFMGTLMLLEAVLLREFLQTNFTLKGFFGQM